MSVAYKEIEHWIPLQKQAEKAMLQEFEAGNYTIEAPLLKYNAYLINPLSAVVLFNTEEEVAITVCVKGKTKAADIKHTFPKAKKHILPIVGLYNDYNNTVEITPYRGKTTTLHIEVGNVVNNNVIEYIQTTPEYFQDNIMILCPADIQTTVGIDYAGDVRWHLTILCVFDIKRLKNGNLLYGTDRLVKMPYYMSGLYEMSAVGKIYKEYRVPGAYHHDQFEMKDGNLLCLTEDMTSETVEDICVLIDRNTGEILKTWDYKQALVPGEGKGLSYSAEDWFHNNAVWYDEVSHSLTFSGRHIDAITNIDYETGKLNWIIGDPETWPENMQKYFFKPIGNNFGWQYEQHACVITPDGDVMCFDNHHNGTKVEERKIPAKDNYSRGVRYKINTDDMTIEQVWEYGKDRGADFFSPYICNVEYYKEGHYMVHSGGIAYDKDGVPSEALGAFAAMAGGTQKSITVELVNDTKMYELKAKGNFYRAEKIKLYTDGINLEMGEGKILGYLSPTTEFQTAIPAEACGEMLPESCNARFEEEFDKFAFFARFMKGDLAMLLLEQGEEVHRYYIPTTAVPAKAMCCGSFLDTDDRNTRTVVTKTGLKGTYDVRIILEDKKYETGIQITC
ncbi:MAG: aryl-sulfate sulfotransferase [Cellulosilyticaceae bacterium]